MQNLAPLDWNEILQRLAKFATSEAGRHHLQNLLPLSSATAAKESFQKIQEAQAVLAIGGQRPFMESLDLFMLWHQRLSKDAALKPLELKDVRRFCLEIIALKEILNSQKTPWVRATFEQLMDATEPLSAIDQLMTPEGDIRTDASETLHRLFQEKQTHTRGLQAVLDRLIRQHEMESVLQDRYVTNREGRWVLPVRSGMQHHFDGIIHASSQTKQTVFMEPKEIIPMNNRLRQIEVEIEDEIERLLVELSKYLKSRKTEFETARELLLECDTRFAQAQLSSHMRAVPCEFRDHEIDLIELRHPLLVLNNVSVVANTVHLGSQKRLLLLSGPNAGGKTVLLKSIGLAAQMACCGLHIAAEEGSCLPFFNHLYVAIGDSQSVDQHLSTFAAHLRILNQATQNNHENCLLLIDEICGSTDPEEGTALARAFIETYAKQKSFAVITSHLGPLKSGWGIDSGVVNGSLEYDNKTGRPTYHFIMGVPGQSLAIQTARRVGVQTDIIERALSHLSPETKRYHLGLEEVDAMKSELRALKEQLLRENQEARAMRSKYQDLLQRHERDREKMLEHALRRAEKKIEGLIETSKVEDIFKRHERLEKLKYELPEVVKTVKPQGLRTQISTLDDFMKAYPPGSKVFAPSIGRDAVVQGQPNSKGEVPILSNSMRLVVPWQVLRPPQQAINPTHEIIRRSGELASPLELERSVDVRGLSVEEALSQLEIQLDTAALNQEERLKIVHGHGTEALKRSIRGYLSRSVYVKKWQAGTPETGGDGVTWVELSG